MNRLRAGRWLLLLLLCLSPMAFAQNCTVSSTPVAFGAYDPVVASSPLDASGQVSVDCFKVWYFTLSLSTGGSGSYAARRMASGTNTLQYNLYVNAARTTVFGDGSGGSQIATCQFGISCGGSSHGNFWDVNLSFYGRIPAGQDVAAGSYSDTVQVVVTF